ncbi:uncharacterized protein LOC126999693 isoform X2 [Eriocheir sinensis]|nr:uncharacterized protein LOC126999693 isoform X2 [Eriocheir sinensis]XP_050718392.1 uncharacterized protein LOC126999693 isoform X2 [Eriocheir sinensis]
MEVTDVSQLMSLFGAGTVSIICDPTQLEGASGDISESVLASEAASNRTSILNQSHSAALVIREDGGKERTTTIRSPCSAEDGMEREEFSASLSHAGKEGKHVEYESDKSPQLQLSTEHYFIQTTDGKLIQVLGTLEQDAGGGGLPEMSLVEGVMEASAAGHMEGSSDGVQILVVGGGSEDVYLISTPDKDAETCELQSSLPLGVKNSSLLEDSEDGCILQPGSTMISTLAARGSQERPLVKDDLLQASLLIEGPNIASRQQCKGSLIKAEGNSLLQDSLLIEGPKFDSRQQCEASIIKGEGDNLLHESLLIEGPQCKGSLIKGEGDSLLQDSLPVGGHKFDSRQQSCKGSDDFSSFPEEPQLCSRDLLTSLPFLKSCHQKTPKDKQIFPLKIASKSPSEEFLVKTDRGDMVACNLSSLPQLRETGGQATRLQNVASMFGPALKVLRPVEANRDLTTKTISNQFSTFSCSECSAVLHSEHSLQNHQRKYHKAWEEECVVCGRKFLNDRCVRAHMQEAHSDQDSFQCRLCSFKCECVKDFLRHYKFHRQSRVCGQCGRKYITLKLYEEHVKRCRGKRKSQAPRRDSDLTSTPHSIPEEEQTQGGQDRNCIRTEQRNKDRDDTKPDGSTNDSSDASHARRKLAKTSTDNRLVRRDDEFRFESKYYNKQAKKLAQEQVSVPAQRSGRGGRERTHRCYLCFKLFPTAKALETHKENYHLAKSERPVRVKTYAGLEESEEPGNSSAQEPRLPCEALEEVMVKEEPAELSEDFDNITIIIDESVKPHVLKPLCIACRAHTSDDFRKHSKWFSQVPDDFQSDLLKKFQQFLPCTFDPASLVEPWVLCKKCAVLIDKIADMEEKLNSMKSDLLSRVRGSSEASSDTLQKDLSSESNTGEGSHTGFLGSLTEGNVEGLGKSLSDIEAYMKDTCEIMEITKPHKRPGRPRKRVEEKLTPVLVEGREEGESTSGIAGVIAQSLVNNEQENRQVTLGPANNSDTKNEEEKSPSKAGVQSDITFDNVKFKEEPMQYELDSDGSNSGSWDVILGNQDSQFDSAGIEPEKRGQLDSQSFSPETILNSLEGAAQTESQTEILEAKKTTDFLGSQKSKPQSYCETFSLENIPISISTKSQDVDAADDEGCDTPETLASRDSLEGDSALQRDVTDHAGEAQEATASTEEHPGKRPATPLLLEDNKTDLHPLTVAQQERKRARLREERRKMCCRKEELSPRPWQCRECLKTFSTERGACDHYAASHKGENYACEFCGVSYVRKRDLIGHYNKMHLNIKPYKCKLSDCPETFSSHSQLYRHMQAVHSRKKGSVKHECHMCGASFSERRYRDAHLLVCATKGSDSVPHKCPYCHKAFKLAKYLQLHMRTVHWKDEQFFCEICSKILTDKKNLIIHMKSHMGQTKAKCKVCGKEFNRKSYLWTHMRTHTDHRPYKCNYCNKAFAQYSTRKNHERTHTGEKPYKCHICSANFATSSSLSKHVQYSHHNIRAFECEICKKKFISRAKIEEHIKVHTGERPFKCHVCFRAFNKKNNLRTHMYVHSANKKYKCELCGEGFMRKSTIENHILERHKLEIAMSSSSTTNKDGSVSASTAQFITMKGADDVPPEDSYIVVYADEDEELSDPKEMQVTVLAEDDTSSQIGITATSVPTAADCSEALTAMASRTDVLSEVILEGSSGRGSDALTALISNSISSDITIPEGSDATVSHVMEIDGFL